MRLHIKLILYILLTQYLSCGRSFVFASSDALIVDFDRGTQSGNSCVSVSLLSSVGFFFFVFISATLLH